MCARANAKLHQGTGVKGNYMATDHSKAVYLPAPGAVLPREAYSSDIKSDGLLNETLLAEELFHSTLTLERRRAERSRRPFVLMLLDAHRENGLAKGLLQQARSVIAASTRETDLVGWYATGASLGIIFTELGSVEGSEITNSLRIKLTTALQERMGIKMAAKIAISVHLFPEEWDQDSSNWVADSKLYPDLQPRKARKKVFVALKRVMDVAASLTVLLLLSPLVAVIALIIKMTSKGPVLFEQERLGQFGARFKCLKFRTMYLACDPTIHQDYVQKFIAGQAEANQDHSAPAVYKIVDDPRVTTIGRFLRKSSLDEIPQFWNVLRGEMSLVGPRPPVPYEFEVYDIWHRRRVLEMRPGITGLWQVSGRSRIRFDDMVRLDLRYCQTWSLWLDLKILIATPAAVLSGTGAY